MQKAKALTILPILTLMAAASMAAYGSTITATLPSYDGAPNFDFNPADYPLAPATIGTFTFTIPNGAGVLGATISGTFGNNDDPGVTGITAISDFFVNSGGI